MLDVKCQSWTLCIHPVYVQFTVWNFFFVSFIYFFPLILHVLFSLFLKGLVGSALIDKPVQMLMAKPSHKPANNPSLYIPIMPPLIVFKFNLITKPFSNSRKKLINKEIKLN